MARILRRIADWFRRPRPEVLYFLISAFAVAAADYPPTNWVQSKPADGTPSAPPNPVAEELKIELPDIPEVARRLFVENAGDNVVNIRRRISQIDRGIPKSEPNETTEEEKRDIQPADIMEILRRSDADRIDLGVESVGAINRPIENLVFQGDILLDDSQTEKILKDAEEDEEESAEQNEEQPKADKIRRRKRQAQTGSQFPENQWKTSRPISYKFSKSMNSEARAVVRTAIAFWESNTCLRFEEKGKPHPRVRFFRGGGCYSNVGRLVDERRQSISIGKGCAQFGIVAHEIGHTLGFFHSQSRHDRDEHIKVLRKRLSSEMRSQFEKQSKRTNNNFGVGYDYGSVMHYPDTDPHRGKVMMLARDPIYQHTMGNSVRPSFADILTMNRYYNCLDRCDSVPTNCQFGGFPNPNQCDQCICPSGFGGPDCSQLQKGEHGAPEDCGAVLEATAQPQELHAKIQAQKSMARRHAVCYWQIRAPAGQRVELELLEARGACSSGCFYAGVELKVHNLSMTGARICCSADVENLGALRSATEMTVVSAYTATRPIAFGVRYRAVSDSDSPPTRRRLSQPNAECGEREECENWKANGFCDSELFTDRLRRRHCGKTCGLCVPAE